MTQEIETKKQLGFGEKVAWGIGGMADTLMSNTLFSLAIPIYCIGLGVNPVLMGISLSLPRIWEAITDPLMGNISDNTRSRFGRRRPFIIIGSIAASILFAMIWMPPKGLGEYALCAYFTVASILFFSAYTVFTVPWTALGYELTSDYDERTKVMAYKGFLASLACAAILPWPYKLSFLPIFGNNEIEGVKYVGIIYGLAMLILGIIPGIFCKEQVAKQKQPQIKLMTAIKETSKNKPFLILCGIIVTIITGIYLVNPLSSYILIYYVYGGVKSDGATLLAISGSFYNILGMTNNDKPTTNTQVAFIINK